MTLATNGREALLLGRTVAHLAPAQVGHRLRLRAAKAALARWPDRVEHRWRQPAGPPVWPQSFVAIDRDLDVGRPSPEDNAKGTFEFMADRRHLGDPIDWRPDNTSQLWRYHLHYWEWAWPLAGQTDPEWAQANFERLWRSWRQGTRFGRWDEWSPYVVSIRVWVLCNLFGPLAAGTSLEELLLADLRRHAGFVAANLELDVGGNHLIKNLKALIGCGVFFGDERLSSLGIGHLERQLPIQVLADGGHFERSPSYHAQVLGDLLDIQMLLAAGAGPEVAGLDSTIARMRGWLATMLLPDGDVPPLNDSTVVGPARLRALGVAMPRSGRLAVLAASGYAVIRADDRLHLVVDVGPPCPPQLPAHAQADCLTFELAIDGRRFIVDPGTSTYEPGARRAWERSTTAHNTVAVDNADQTELWGTFRAARLAHAFLEQATDDGTCVTVTGSHDGYRRLAGRPWHRRSWEMIPDRLIIRDQVTGTGTHNLRARWQLAPGVEATITGARSIRAGAAVISIAAPDEAQLRILPAGSCPGGVAMDFGESEPAAAIELALHATLPVAWTTTIDLEDGPS